MPPTYSIYGMEARSKRFSNRCNTAELKQNICFCILTFKFDRLGDKQSYYNDTSDNRMADTTLVYSANSNVHTATIALTSPTKPITKSPGRKTLSRKNEVRKVSDVGKLQENLGNRRNFKQCSQNYLYAQDTKFYCRLRIGLDQEV